MGILEELELKFDQKRKTRREMLKLAAAGGTGVLAAELAAKVPSVNAFSNPPTGAAIAAGYMSLVPQASRPAGIPQGGIWVRSVDNEPAMYDGTNDILLRHPEFHVKSYGAKVDGTTDDSSAAAAAIAAAIAAGGGVVVLPPGTMNTATTGITIAAGTLGVTIRGESPDGSVIKYTGTGKAIKIGGSGSVTQRCRLENLKVDISGAGSSAIAIYAQRFSQMDIINVQVQTAFSGNTQIAVQLDGTGGFSAYAFLSDIRIGGSMLRGIDMINTVNACTLVGCTVILSPATPGASTRGLSIDSNSNSNDMVGGDYEGWDLGCEIDGVGNVFAGAHLEQNTAHMVLGAASSGNLIMASWSTAFTITDNGTDNQIVGRFSSKITNLVAVGSPIQNTDLVLQARRNQAGTAFEIQTYDSAFTTLLSRIAINCGALSSASFVSFNNANIDMVTNNIKRIGGLSGSNGIAQNFRAVDVALGNGVNTLAVTFGTNEIDGSFAIFVSFTYNAGAYWITARGTTGFTINWVTVTPDANQKLSWLLIR